jgi:hypothetical protein
MKKFLLTYFAIIYFSASIFASNHAFDLTATGTKYLKTTNAPLTGNSAYTIEFWFNNNGNSYSSYARLLGFTGFAMDLGINNGALTYYDGSNWHTTTATGMATGWHHVAVTNNLTNVYVYVDGVQVYTMASLVSNFTGKYMYVGISSQLLVADRIRAYYDEIRIWNSAKTLSEINLNRVKQLVGNESTLIGYYPMNKGSFSDLTASANHMINTGSVVDKVFNFGLNVSDYGMNFDASDDFCSVSTPLTTSDFTIEAQFKTTSTTASAYRRIFSWTNYGLEIAVVNGVLYTYRNSWSATTATGLNNGNWHHVALTKTATTLTIFVDGVQVGQRTVAVTLSGNMLIGGPEIFNTTNDFFNGTIDEVRVWNTARSQSSIIATMDSTLVGNETNLISYYDMNTPTTTVLNVAAGGAAMNRYGATGVNNLPQFVSFTGKTVPPMITAVTPASICGNGTLTLTSAASGGTINWYTVSTGGSSIGTGTSFTTPTLSATTTYYVDATKNSIASSARTPIIATVNTIPTITSTSPASACENQPVVLNSTASAGTVNWYAALTGGLSLQTATAYTTAVLSSTTTYYVDATLNGCTSLTRTPIIATIIPFPIITAASTASNCGPGNVTLTGSSNVGTISWFQQISSGSALQTGTTYTTSTLNSDVSYFIEATNNGCINPIRFEVAITILPVPEILTSLSAANCGPGSINLNATTNFGNVTWYTDENGTNPVYIGPNYTTPVLSTSTIYYIDASDNGCYSSPRLQVNAAINDIPSATVTQNLNVLNADVIANATYQWIDCLSQNLPINGETNSTYTASQNGSFAVVIDLNGCSATSDCYTIDFANISNLEATDVFQMYPNPAKANVTIISFSENAQVVEVYSLEGQLLLNETFSKKMNLDVSILTKGIYIVQVRSENKVNQQKIVIE